MATKIVDVRQPDSKDPKAVLPPNIKVINVTYTPTGDSGETFAGNFHIKRLTLGDIRRVAIRRVELNGGVDAKLLSESVAYLNTMLAHLEHALVDVPNWWKPDSFYDGGPISAIYDKAMEFEDSFRRPANTAPGGDQANRQEQSGNSGVPTAPVVGQ